MNILKILIDIFIIIGLGYCLGDLFLFDTSYEFLKKLSLSYAVGFGAIGLQLLFYSTVHVNWNLLFILTPWIFLALAYITLRRPTINFKDIKNSIKKILAITKIEKFIAILILLLILFVGIESIIRPIQTWDGWDTWVFRSNVFYTKNAIDPYYFSYTTDQYPLIIPLTATFGYMTLGKIDDSAILLFYFMFYASLGVLFYAESKEFFSRKFSLLLTFLLLSTQNFIRHGGRFEVGQADLAVGFYIFAGSILLFDYLKFKSRKSILFLSIILGIAGQIKNDALPFVIFTGLIAFVSIVRDKNKKQLVYLLPLPFLLIFWEFFKKINHFHPPFLTQGGVILHFDRILLVSFLLLKEFANFQNWNLLWITFFVCLIMFPKSVKRNKLFISLIAVQFFSYFLVFLITKADPALHIAGLANKLYLHIAPLAVLVVGLLSYPVLKSIKK